MMSFPGQNLGNYWLKPTEYLEFSWKLLTARQLAARGARAKSARVDPPAWRAAIGKGDPCRCINSSVV